ncbi:MAG: hypothetical protein H6919_03735 [Sphingomonadaceae bacterium]|nr:hypothetical protein [Sphingomonadaceae bacterium]MCP5384107.1 hypothetical protein [Altererythrobacter sp.]MCP5393011.1 hypothetical protein [Sphingomonadaceae bacterium]
MKFPARLGARAKFPLIAGIGALCMFAPATAQAPTLAMLDRLDKGEWELRYRDGGASKKICVRTGREFIQLRHTATNCSRYVVEDAANEVTVQYTCPGDGYGRTNIRRETSALVQIKGQGIKSSVPFQFTAEARRIGNCK